MASQPTQGTQQASTASNVQPIPLVDVCAQHAHLEEEIQAAIARICQQGSFVMGPDVADLEKSVADYSGCEHGIACASGSDALLLALLALGVGRGHEVILPSFTFFATAGSVWQSGAKPVFVDIDPVTYTIDPEAVAEKITPATRAIIPVHLYGQCANMAPLVELAKQHKLSIVEAAAQAIGAEFQGTRAGALGDIGCFSFYPTKNLGCFGDGGMLTTRNDELAERLRLLRVHGMKPRYHHKIVGINSRLDSTQAAILKIKFPHLETWTGRRTTNAARYDKLFAAAKLAKLIELPIANRECRHVWNQYVIRVPADHRDALRAHLQARKIGTEVYYPVPLHKQECFEVLGTAGDPLPETNRAATEVIALPVAPGLTEAQQESVVEAIAGYFHEQGLLTGSGSAIKGPNFLKSAG